MNKTFNVRIFLSKTEYKDYWVEGDCYLDARDEAEKIIKTDYIDKGKNVIGYNVERIN